MGWELEVPVGLVSEIICRIYFKLLWLPGGDVLRVRAFLTVLGMFLFQIGVHICSFRSCNLASVRLMLWEFQRLILNMRRSSCIVFTCCLIRLLSQVCWHKSLWVAMRKRSQMPVVFLCCSCIPVFGSHHPLLPHLPFSPPSFLLPSFLPSLMRMWCLILFIVVFYGAAAALQHLDRSEIGSKDRGKERRRRGGESGNG